MKSCFRSPHSNHVESSQGSALSRLSVFLCYIIMNDVSCSNNGRCDILYADDNYSPNNRVINIGTGKMMHKREN